jgi:hypothetical protein
MPLEPTYHVTITEIHSDQRVFVGVHRGPLTPLLEEGGIILEHTRVTDAGRRLTKAQLKKAYHNANR